VIPFVCTFLVATYILGPDLFAGWILGFVVQRKNLSQSRSEQITRGILWSIVPLSLAWSVRHFGPLALPQNSKIDMQMFFSGLYSESFFNIHQTDFYVASGSFIALNECVLFRLYFIVLVSALLLNFLILKYGLIRNFLMKTKRPGLLRLFSAIVLPRISEWHVILSPIILPAKEMNIVVDILTKSGILYSGTLEDKVVGADGNLQTVTLRYPKRFRRDQFVEARKNSPETKPEVYWKTIPGNLFVIMASDIATLNIRHLPANVISFSREFTDIAEALKEIAIKARKKENSEIAPPNQE
jgi:hypothetical protein